MRARVSSPFGLRVRAAAGGPGLAAPPFAAVARRFARFSALIPSVYQVDQPRAESAKPVPTLRHPVRDPPGDGPQLGRREPERALAEPPRGPEAHHPRLRAAVDVAAIVHDRDLAQRVAW